MLLGFFFPSLLVNASRQMDIITSVGLTFAGIARELVQKLNIWQENCDAKDSPDNNIIVINF